MSRGWPSLVRPSPGFLVGKPKETVCWKGWDPAWIAGVPSSLVAGATKPARKPKSTASSCTGVGAPASAALAAPPPETVAFASSVPGGVAPGTATVTCKSNQRPGWTGLAVSQVTVCPTGEPQTGPAVDSGSMFTASTFSIGRPAGTSSLSVVTEPSVTPPPTLVATTTYSPLFPGAKLAVIGVTVKDQPGAAAAAPVGKSAAVARQSETSASVAVRRLIVPSSP